MTEDFHILAPLELKQAAQNCPLLEGDVEAWIVCCSRRFFPLARRVAGEDDLAKDVLQTSWVKILQAINHTWTSRSTRAGRLPVLLVIFAVLAGCQPQSEDSQDIGEDRKAAERGHAGGQFNLGLMYGRREGVPKDHRQAAKWYRKAAEQGHADAQCELGLMYKTGKGVPENYKEAVKWLRLAAEQGEPRAQYTLVSNPQNRSSPPTSDKVPLCKLSF